MNKKIDEKFNYLTFCALVLRTSIHNLNIDNNFKIIDDIDKKQILKDIYQYDFKKKPEEIEIKLLSSFISQWKNHNLTKDEIISGYYDEEKGILRNKVYERYQEYQKLNNCLDFDDLSLLVAKLFKEYPEIEKKIQKIKIKE